MAFRLLNDCFANTYEESAKPVSGSTTNESRKGSQSLLEHEMLE